MRAIEISTPGGPEVLRVIEREIPTPRSGELLIRVCAAGVNRPDVLQRKGMYPVPAGASDLPGLEVAGVIAGGDLANTKFSLGDPVCALANGGGYAEYCVVPAGQCLPCPNGLTFQQAAAVPETFFTVWANIFDRARFQSGQTVMIHGGSSGIGVAAIQMVKAMKGRVIVTAGSAEKCEACLGLGADAAINYRTEDFVEMGRNLTEGRGVDVLLDMVAGNYVARNLSLLADDGTAVIIAVQGGTSAQVDAGDILRRRLTLTGSTLRPRSAQYKSYLANQLLTHIWPHLESGVIRPTIDRVFDFADAVNAHRYMEAGEHIGKIVLQVSQD